MLWEIDVYPAPGQPDLAGRRVATAARDLHLGDHLQVGAVQGYLLQGELSREQAEDVARRLLVDSVVERAVIAPAGDAVLATPPEAADRKLVHVLPKPGVMDPVADSAVQAIAGLGLPAAAVRTFRKYWIAGLDQEEQLLRLATRLLSNDAIEQVVIGPLRMERLELGSNYDFRRIDVPLRDMDNAQLVDFSRRQQLSLTLEEMRVIQQHYREQGRHPTDAELETIAQTWSEHCSHKTLKGRIRYRCGGEVREFSNMLKETIFAATVEVRRRLGAHDWCVSVFEDNAGIVRFDDDYNVVFKVETHNHPSAIEPYGGANTGLGGVIRDSLGTGLGARPICNTNVFCFAPPDVAPEELPPGVLHPRRVMQGVVSGVRDYGNRMGIPTVNGALYFDPRYLGNPLVYCGNVGLLPRGKSRKEARPGDWIVVVGGRTGRDGIHGATFSSIELTSESESISGGAVQIGNAITEKMLTDVILQARDRGLFTAITDCGAGGLSSAVGEMGETIGARVHLERAPLKYDGLSYSEIWISEAQERMVLAVPPEHWEAFRDLCASEGVEATAIGQFVPTGRLELRFHHEVVADLSMSFLHDGRPPTVREAEYQPRTFEPLQYPDPPADLTGVLRDILGSYNVCSKEWVIRQYDHEVQGGSVVKPLTGVRNDGPSDAAVIRPRLDSQAGLVVACGMNPCYGDLDPYHMAASAIDEAVRNCVAVGGDPRRVAILDNFCWGNTQRPEQLGSLVRAALACYDVAVTLQTPFVSGKDSLNNEFRYEVDGQAQSIAIPPSLLISALGQIDDVRRAVTMDLKQPGSRLYLVGWTRPELGGSHLARTQQLAGGTPPHVDAELARRIFLAVHHAIDEGSVRACHDLSEGGLAVAVAEMAFSGELGARLHLNRVPYREVLADPAHEREIVSGDPTPPADDPRSLGALAAATLLFSESNTRFLCEVPEAQAANFERVLAGLPVSHVGEVLAEPQLEILGLNDDAGRPAIASDLASLKEAWQAPLRW